MKKLIRIFDAADELFEHMSKFSRAEIRSKLRTAFGNYTTIQPKAELSLEEFLGFYRVLPLSPMKRSGEYLTHTGIIMNMCRNFRISSVPQWTL